MVTGGGLVLLALFVMIGRRNGGGHASAGARAAIWFIPTWFMVSAINLWTGVTQAGYTVEEERPGFGVVFGVPAAAALLFWWKFSKAGPP
jgi:hypothetical protein